MDIPGSRLVDISNADKLDSPIENQDLPTSWPKVFLAYSGCNTHVVEEAEAHRRLHLSMVTGRSDDSDGVLDLALNHSSTSVDCCSSGELSREVGQTVEVD